VIWLRWRWYAAEHEGSPQDDPGRTAGGWGPYLYGPASWELTTIRVRNPWPGWAVLDWFLVRT